ncbi:MAG: hypothetical protein J0L70_25955 [Leptolyngbya sp. UWPOB_LEPTO1]|uniref:hypothetical protein n=1 Tax=Leptolyngbya sp. UWPOB_LEPTO1 TaxID=2815653 RepID=UPI001ACF5DED|nr:hypothetical protein [Leptolyngbya sp. UWPOB_LEPTO1]MBN8563983.1 hypothetical protein [Leptolyngbya sp. UWPOB_LEPTO1]
MSIQDQARALMVRHRQMIRNREQSMLTRQASEVGMPSESAQVMQSNHHGNIENYDRSNVGLS